MYAEWLVWGLSIVGAAFLVYVMVASIKDLRKSKGKKVKK